MALGIVTFFLCVPPGLPLSARPLPGITVRATDSLEVAGLAAALGTIFSQEKIASILSNLPPKSKIYGYDIGEYSGDDGMDVVLSIRRSDARDRTIDVLFFLNDGPGFRHLRTLRRRYMSEPIEVGFAIEAGVCHVTEKTGEFAWHVTGYTAREGIFRRVEEWTTGRMRTGGRTTGVGFDRKYSYETLIADEHYYGANTERSFMRRRFYDLPVYPAGLSLPDAMRTTVGDSSAMIIARGGSSWYGADDCSLFCSARYDSSTVTFSIRVHDDRLLYHQFADSSDHLDLHFDMSRRNRVRPDGKVQTYSAGSQFGIRIVMGDGGNRTPVVELLGDAMRKRFGDDVHVSTQRLKTEYQTYAFTISVPLALFREGARLPSAGFVCAYHDVDHPGSLRWVSQAATAREYFPGKPDTYGRLHFVADPVDAYEWENLRVIALSEELKSAGIIP